MGWTCSCTSSSFGMGTSRMQNNVEINRSLFFGTMVRYERTRLVPSEDEEHHTAAEVEVEDEVEGMLTDGLDIRLH